jgi:adenylate kinase family enzyme
MGTAPADQPDQANGTGARGAIAIGAFLEDAPPRPTRIAILGGGGSGKSTLALRLGAALGLPIIHLDRLVYGPAWARQSPNRVRENLLLLVEKGPWIVDGAYVEAAPVTLPRADLILWLDQPVWRRLYRAWRKTRDHQGKPRPDRPDDCEETFGWSYVSSILSFGRLSRDLERWLGELAKTPVVRLRGDRDIARLLAWAAQPQESTAPTLRAATGPLREAG